MQKPATSGRRAAASRLPRAAHCPTKESRFAQKVFDEQV